MKTACVIQGDIRRGSNAVISYMRGLFDVVILSTWKNELSKLENLEDFEKIENAPPSEAGYSHRNYQRKSTAAGIKRARELGCTHVLKWRTDMIPSKLNVSQLLEWSNYNMPDGVSSRIVTCAYRNYTVDRDWFSSIPDLFSFGDIDTMELLWGDDGFDYLLKRNLPAEMEKEEDLAILQHDTNGDIWCAESELYAHFKNRLQLKLHLKLTHEQIAKNYMRLIDHEKLGIIWFGKNSFRPIFQAWQHNWWTENTWNGTLKVKKGAFGYSTKGMGAKLKARLSFMKSYLEIQQQQKYYKQLIKSKHLSIK